MENYYDIFGVSPDASKAEIERAYKRLSKAYHPDAGATNDHMFKKVHEIYKILTDNQARAEYDHAYMAASDAEEKQTARATAREARTAAGAAQTPGTKSRRATPRSTGEDWSTPKKPEKPDVFTMMKTADELLEKGSWKRADDAYAEILKEKPKEAKAWLGRLMASLHVKEKQELAGVPKSFEKNEYYLRCRSCAGKMLKEELDGYMETAKTRSLSEKYDAAVVKMKACDSPKSWQQVAVMFKALGEFKDAEALAKRCRSKADGVKNDDVYKRAMDLMNLGDAASLVEAVGVLQKIPDWKDSEEQIQECYRLLADLKAKEADKPYQIALSAMKSAETMQDFNHAAVLFEALGDYRDAKRKAKLCRNNAESTRLDVMYKKAVENMAGDKFSSYEDAIAIFKELDGWKDSEEQIAKCQKMILEIKRDRYAKATALMEAGSVQEYLQAAGLFSTLQGYRDSRKQSENCKKEASYCSGLEKMKNIPKEEYSYSKEKGKAYYLDQLADCNDALELFSEIPGWRDADELAAYCGGKAEELKKLIPKIPESSRGPGKNIVLIAGVVVAFAAAAGLALLLLLK